MAIERSSGGGRCAEGVINRGRRNGIQVDTLSALLARRREREGILTPVHMFIEKLPGPPQRSGQLVISAEHH